MELSKIRLGSWISSIQTYVAAMTESKPLKLGRRRSERRLEGAGAVQCSEEAE